MTETGPSTFDKLLGTWLDYQAVKHQADLESRRTDTNIPDRVDVATGGARSPLAVSSSMPWGTVLLIAGGVLAGAFVLRALR